MKRIKHYALVLLPGVLFLIFWQVIVQDSARLKFLFASPKMIAEAAAAELTHVSIWLDCLTTLGESLLGLFFGTLLGTCGGLLLWGDRKIDAIVRPYVIVLGAIPVFALAPIMIVWFGIGLLSKAIMAGFAVFFVSLVQAYEGAHVVAGQYSGFARSLDAPHRRMILKLVIPGSIRWVLTGFRMNVGFALTGAFIAEFVSSEAGIGHYILKASSLYDMPRVFLGLLLISLMAIILTAAANRLQERLHITDSDKS